MNKGVGEFVSQIDHFWKIPMNGDDDDNNEPDDNYSLNQAETEVEQQANDALTLKQTITRQ